MPRFCANRLAGSTPLAIEFFSAARAGSALRLAVDAADLAAAEPVALAGAFAVEAALPDAAEPVGSNTICCGVTEPGSGIATPEGFAGLPLKGNDWPLCSVRLASGSFSSRKAFQIWSPDR